jgi:invasion protein IalB
MRLFKTAAAALFVAGLSLPAFAETAPTPPPPPAPPVAQTPAPDPEQARKDAYDNEIVCRTEDETGTRLRKTKTCMTRKQWRTGETNSQDAVAAAQRRAAQSGTPGN